MSPQAPIKTTPETRERLRYLAPLLGTTQSDIVDRAVQEFAVRHADVIAKGIDHARTVIAGGDSAIAAHLLDVPIANVERISGTAT
jgi:predicted DNA-binding protein